ncbi:hypothetical protein XENOCAPTIV_008682, partial [Xenoophorus captivus]
VTIEVVEDSQTETEVEMDLARENQRNDWSGSSSEWINSHSKLFWPLFWVYPEQPENRLGGTSSEEQSEDYSYDPGDPVLSGVGADWGRRWKKDWETKDNVGKTSQTLFFMKVCKTELETCFTWPVTQTQKSDEVV